MPYLLDNIIHQVDIEIVYFRERRQAYFLDTFFH